MKYLGKNSKVKIKGMNGGGGPKLLLPFPLTPFCLLFSIFFYSCPLHSWLPNSGLPLSTPSIFKVGTCWSVNWIKGGHFQGIKKKYSILYDIPTPLLIISKKVWSPLHLKIPMNLNVLIVYLEMHNYTPKSWWHN